MLITQCDTTGYCSNITFSLTHTAVLPLPGRRARTSIATIGEVHNAFAIMKTRVHGTVVD